MTDNKPAGLSWESLAERRIREAIEQGDFANLPGQGAPIPGIGDPSDENWWIRKKLRDEDLSVVHPVLQARLAIEKTRHTIRELSDETAVRHLLEKLNQLIHEAHHALEPGPPQGVPPVSIEAEVAAWKRHRASSA